MHSKLNLAVLLFLILNTVCTSGFAEVPLTIHTYRADDRGFDVASVLIAGETDAVLIDAQFTLSDAHRVVAEALSSGKRLKLVYISQGDPDYYFGLEVIKQAFPDVKIVATQATVNHIRESLPVKLRIWGPRLGANGPKLPIVPDVLAGNSLELEGRKMEIIGIGAKPLYTFVWIPSIKAVVGGVRVFGDMHLWMTDSQTTAARECWIADLKRIEALNPQVVVPGHAKKDVPADLSQVRFSEEYLVAYGEELGKAKNSAALILAMQARYPDAIGESVLELGAQVNKGEIPWAGAASCN